MATYVEKLVGKTVNVITNEGRNFIGNLTCFDQKMNIILTECEERIYSQTKEVEVESFGSYFIRGDNIAIIGEIDPTLEQNIDYKKIKAPALKPMQIH
jgi:U6 snRNA-associated Sm-like protein LSm8